MPSTTLADLIQNHYRSAPRQTCIVVQEAGKRDIPISYQALIEGSHGYACAYARQNVKPGDVVILILQHGEELIYAFWGAILHGAIPSIMPFLTEKLSPDRYRSDLGALFQVADPKAIVTYAAFEGEVLGAMKPGDPQRAVIIAERIERTAEVDFERLPGVQRAPGDIVLLQHSSGTTGLQKGVALSHRAVLNQLNAYTHVLRLAAHDTIVSWLPLYHDMGLIAGFLMPILSGIPLILLSPFDWVRAPHRIMHAVSQYRGTLSWLPNFAYNFCAQKIQDRQMDDVNLSTWRAVINCSEPVKWESHQAFYRRFERYGLRPNALQCSYAMAENVFGVTQTDLDAVPVTDDVDREDYITKRIARPAQEGRPALRMMSSGKPLSNTRVRVLDEQGRSVSDHVIGEIALHSDCMLTEYYNRPDATVKAFAGDWFLTGDYGYTLDGELFVAGRKKDMIIVGGKNIYPQDLESLSYEVPGIHAGRAVAFGVFDEDTGTEEVVIVAEVDTTDADERQQIADALRTHVARNSAVVLRNAYIVDNKWIIKTSSGKTARSANRDKFLREAGHDF